ncbi:unnamed protein product [Symbiodinium sp. CCMP2592]|nr:unnamed protein product [Symbiodinium sp. CCMP2592]
METLEKKGQQHELNLLDARVELCEHAFGLAYSNLSMMKQSLMQAHVMKTKKLWANYPVSLQLGILTRHAQHSLEQMVLSKKKDSESWKEPAQEFVTFFSFDVAEMLTADPSSCETSFQGHAPTWQTGLMKMILAAGELAEDSLCSIKLDDEDGAMTAEAAQVKTAELQSIATDCCTVALEITLEKGGFLIVMHWYQVQYRYTCVVNLAATEWFVSTDSKPGEQDFANKLRGLFTHSSWSELLNLQEKATDVHIYVCKHLYKHIDAMSSLFTSWIDTPLVPIAEAFEQVLAMAKAILHMHAWDPASEADTDSLKPTVPSDVFDFLRCDKQFERSLSKTLQDGSWKAAIADIAKTAGSRPLVQAQWRELNDLLEEMTPEGATAQHLSRIAELFETVSKGMREREMHHVSSKCKDLVVGVARHLMQSQPVAVDMSQLSKQADVVTSLLRRFGQEPEIPTLLDDFAAWLQGSASQRQLSTLISAMEECARGSIDFKNIKQLVPGVGKDQSYTVPADQAAKFRQAACNFIFKSLLTVNSPAADDAACTQRAADVRLNLAIVNAVAKLVKDFISESGPARDAFNAYINACISLSLAAVFHAKEINLLENLGPDAETRNTEDVNAKRLRQTKSAKMKCEASETTCVAAQSKLQPLVEAEDGSSLHDLVTFKLGEYFHYCNHEVYKDCVLHLLSVSERDLAVLSSSVLDKCRDRHEGGKEWWRRDLPKDAGVNDVLQVAAVNIKGIDGNLLKKDLETVAKDLLGVVSEFGGLVG